MPPPDRPRNAAIARREIPDVQTSRVEHHESGLLSARREYLRVERGKEPSLIGTHESDERGGANVGGAGGGQ